MAIYSFASLQIIANQYSIFLKEVNTLSDEAFDRYNNIMHQPEVKWGGVADIDVSSLRHADTISFLLEKQNIALYATYYNSFSNYSYVHYETSNKEAVATIAIDENNIQADLITSFGKYYITSISNTEVAIIKYESLFSTEPEYEEIKCETVSHSEEQPNIESLTQNTTPSIRLLFLYTSSALMMMNNPQEEHIKMEVYKYINDGNLSFYNSGINAHLELGYIGHTDYNESSHTWSQALDFFSNNGDGIMDNVHTLRNKYAADICILMLNDSTFCGEARTIKANENTAFCIIWASHLNCGARYSAIHEIGHLIGCRHNRAIDNSINPYKYGHGFMHCSTVAPSTSWCTIMSYESTCSANPNRILYWSNPNVFYNSIATGTDTYENNARVWNERAGVVSAFKTEANNITLSLLDNNSAALYESYIAQTSITTAVGYQVQSGQTIDLTAGNEIRLLPNTHIKQGSNFRASIKSEAESHSYPQFIKGKYAKESLLKININPEPATDFVTISFMSSTDDRTCAIQIHDIYGRMIYENSNYPLVSGDNEITINTSSYPTGLYIASVRIADETQSIKFLKQ